MVNLFANHICSYLASRFIYEMGISASQFSFFSFMSKRMAKIQP